MCESQPDFSTLSERLELRHPPIGMYDAPAPAPFVPLVTPGPGECVFVFFQDWMKGKTLHLTQDCFGCGGCGRWMFEVSTRDREDFISFLVDREGLRASRQLMEEWLDASRPYSRKHPNILIGPLKEEQWPYCRTITLFVDADQLSALVYGTHYHSAPGDPPPLIAPFGSGCRELAPFPNMALPQAAIGATDIAMRRYLPPEILAVTLTRPMFGRLCSLDEHSFLFKPFLDNLKRSRK